MGYAQVACPRTRDLSLQGAPSPATRAPSRCSERWGRGTESLDNQEEAMLLASCKNQRFTLPSLTLPSVTHHVFPPDLAAGLRALPRPCLTTVRPQSLPPLALAAAHTPSWTGDSSP